MQARAVRTSTLDSTRPRYLSRISCCTKDPSYLYYFCRRIDPNIISVQHIHTVHAHTVRIYRVSTLDMETGNPLLGILLRGRCISPEDHTDKPTIPTTDGALNRISASHVWLMHTRAVRIYRVPLDIGSRESLLHPTIRKVHLTNYPHRQSLPFLPPMEAPNRISA